jgi:hypothetical protein
MGMQHDLNCWQIYSSEETKKKAHDLREAILKKNLESIAVLFSDTVFLRSLVVMRGIKDVYYLSLQSGFEMLFKKSFVGKENIYDVPALEITAWLQKEKMPEQILNEISHCAFHLRQQEEFEKIVGFIIENASAWNNRQIVARALHDMANWKGVCGDAAAAIEGHKKAIEEARASHEKVIEVKSRFGLSFYKGLIKKEGSDKEYLKPKERAEDLLALANELEKLGVPYDAARATIEAARALLALAMRQDGAQCKETLLHAKDLALSSLKQAKDVSYPHAEISARRILSVAYSVLGEHRKKASYRKQADELLKDFLYKTEKDLLFELEA